MVAETLIERSNRVRIRPWRSKDIPEQNHEEHRKTDRVQLSLWNEENILHQRVSRLTQVWPTVRQMLVSRLTVRQTLVSRLTVRQTWVSRLTVWWRLFRMVHVAPDQWPCTKRDLHWMIYHCMVWYFIFYIQSIIIARINPIHDNWITKMKCQAMLLGGLNRPLGNGKNRKCSKPTNMYHIFRHVPGSLSWLSN